MALFKPKVVLDADLMERCRAHVEQVGYASLEEFVRHCLEKELASCAAADDAVLTERLKGLGYLE